MDVASVAVEDGQEDVVKNPCDKKKKKKYVVEDSK
ncbi:hypothetical protein OROHE_013010 [Orobanche hederae]